jgi:hypothetical protein
MALLLKLDFHPGYSRIILLLNKVAKSNLTSNPQITAM